MRGKVSGHRLPLSKNSEAVGEHPAPLGTVVFRWRASRNYKSIRKALRRDFEPTLVGLSADRPARDWPLHRLLHPRRETLRVLPELFERRFIGEQKHLVAIPQTMLPTSLDKLALFQIAHGIKAGKHRSIAIGIFQEFLLLLRPGEKIGSVAMDDTPPRVRSAPFSRFE